MIRLSDAAFMEMARRFDTSEAFGVWLLDNEHALKLERAAMRAARRSAATGHVESGLRVSVGLQSDKIGAPLDTAVAPTVKPASAEGLENSKVKMAVARKAIPFCRGIVSPNAMEVLAALLDFCNADTLRCGVGLDFIATRLGRQEQADPRRHIRRGISDLVKAGLLKVAPHAGMRHVNVYFPQWDKLAEIVAAFESGERVRIQSDMGDKTVLQTQKKNLPSVVRRVQRAIEPDMRQRSLPLMRKIEGGRAAEASASEGTHPNRWQIARQQARVRLGGAYRQHLNKLGRAGATDFVASVTEADWDIAISAEVTARGSGLETMLNAMFERWVAEGSPLARAGPPGEAAKATG